MRDLKIFVLVAILLAGFSQSGLASPYDGSWVALIPPQQSCNWTSIMTLTLSGNTFEGETRSAGQVEGFTGRIDADGSGTFQVYRRSVGIITFTDGHFDANWNERTCRRHALGDRALTGAEAAASYAQRKQFQARYAALTREATAGDPSVSFTMLRSFYPFTDQWDPYGNETGALLDQAAAAFTGKDCTTAMKELDELLKLDFTIDTAHALRSDCLAAAGQQSAARAESTIANGLIRSLMNSGDGNTEGSAYIVMTQREESDVLANRRLISQRRQTQIRGNNGRLYDVIQATSERNAESAEDVYFDVSSFVNGRKSRIAAVETLESSMP